MRHCAGGPRVRASARSAARVAVNGRAGGGCAAIGSHARGVGTAVTTAPPAAGLFAKRSPSGFRPRAFLRAYVRRRNPWWAVLGLTLALLLILGGMLYALTFILPSATITVAPASEALQVNIPLKAVQDARLDAAAGIVPAQALSVQVAGDARTPTTGRSDEPVGKAQRAGGLHQPHRPRYHGAGGYSPFDRHRQQRAVRDHNGSAVAPERSRRCVG